MVSGANRNYSIDSIEYISAHYPASLRRFGSTIFALARVDSAHHEQPTSLDGGGLAHAIMDQCIVGADEELLGPNCDGEVRMKGPNIMQGYFNMPDETALVFDEKGYFKSGDMGRFDDDGFLYITGRIKEMLIMMI